MILAFDFTMRFWPVIQLFFNLKDNSIDIQDGSCENIEIISRGKSLETINLNQERHDWLGKYYLASNQNTSNEKRTSYRKIEKILDPYSTLNRPGPYYHVVLSYAEGLGYWGVID